MARNFTDLEKAILTQIDGCDYLTEDNAQELQTCIQGGEMQEFPVSSTTRTPALFTTRTGKKSFPR